MNKIISISAIASCTLLISACSLSPNLNIPEANYSIDNKLGALSWKKKTIALSQKIGGKILMMKI